MTQEKKLYRSISDRKIAGIAGGLAEHFNIDPVIIRIAFVLAFLCGGGGLLIYIILWIAIPEQSRFPVDKEQAEPIHSETTNNNTSNNNTSNMENQFETKKERKNFHGNLTGGLILITLGILFLIDRFVPCINFGDLWPVILIVIGITMLIRNIGKKNNNNCC